MFFQLGEEILAQSCPCPVDVTIGCHMTVFTLAYGKLEHVSRDEMIQRGWRRKRDRVVASSTHPIGIQFPCCWYKLLRPSFECTPSCNKDDTTTTTTSQEEEVRGILDGQPSCVLLRDAFGVYVLSDPCLQRGNLPAHLQPQCAKFFHAIQTNTPSLEHLQPAAYFGQAFVDQLTRKFVKEIEQHSGGGGEWILFPSDCYACS